MDSKQPFERVVRDHGATVLRVCRALLGPTDADDAWSETFLAALRAYPELPADANLQAWLVIIAHRKSIDTMRSRQRRALPVEQLPPILASDGVPGHGPDPDLTEALAALSDRQRQAIAYHYLAGLPYAQVAEILGSSTDAVRRAAADGIKKLRGQLAPSQGALQ